jgi:hypothetical protein
MRKTQFMPRPAKQLAKEDFPVSETWLKEIRRRCQELEENKVQTIPAESAIAELRKRFA